MIPRDFITEWRASAPWVADRKVEQDLVISRALVALFSRPTIAESLAFRGGTALYKLHLRRPRATPRTSISCRSGLAGSVRRPTRPTRRLAGRATVEAVRGARDAERPLRVRGRTPVRLELKVETNTREHFTVFGLKDHRFEVSARWFSGSADVRTYELDELLGTKLRALHQRKKGRDLFDLGLALQHAGVSAARILEVFARYTREDGVRVTRAMFEQNLAMKRLDTVFTADMTPLLASGQTWSFEAAYDRVWRELVSRLPGEPWKGA